MALGDIKSTETTTTVLPSGVTVYKNNEVDAVITSEGKVFRTNGKQMNPSPSKTYSMKVGGVMNCVSFTSLFSRMVMGVALKTNTLVLNDVRRGWVKDNVRVIAKARIISTPHSECAKKSNFELNEKSAVRRHYIELEGNKSFVSEDGAVFPTKELAKWHQDTVDKGKTNAQTVMDYNGGWVLAEQIYLNDVKYNKQKPYVNFRDVMENDKGVVEKSTDTTYMFTSENIPKSVDNSAFLNKQTETMFKTLNTFITSDILVATTVNGQINSLIDSINLANENVNKLCNIINWNAVEELGE